MLLLVECANSFYFPQFSRRLYSIDGSFLLLHYYFPSDLKKSDRKNAFCRKFVLRAQNVTSISILSARTTHVVVHVHVRIHAKRKRSALLCTYVLRAVSKKRSERTKKNANEKHAQFFVDIVLYWCLDIMRVAFSRLRKIYCGLRGNDKFIHKEKGEGIKTGLP